MSLNKYILKDKKYLLTFSGGPDSVYSLLHIIDYYIKDMKVSLEYIKEHLFLVYVNYHDSEYVDVEEGIVNKYVSLFNLKLFKVDDYDCINSNKNFENEARVFRYNYFSKIYKENEIDAIIVNHHLNDLVETYLLQKQRNNLVSYYSLQDKTYYNGCLIIRPFLDITKKDIYNYLHENDYDYYEDITNTKDRQRNNLRKYLNENVFPNLEKLNELIETIFKDNKELINNLYKVDKSFIDPENDIVHIDNKLIVSDQFDDDSLIKRILVELIKNVFTKFKIEYNFDFVHTLKNQLFYFVKGNKNDIYTIENLVFLSNNNNYCLTIKDEFYKLFRYSIDFVDKQNILDNEFIYCDFDYLFNKYKLKKQEVIITNSYTYEESNKIKMNSKLKCKNVLEFFREFNIPKAIREIYPIFLNKNKECIFIPKLSDLKSEYLKIRYLDVYDKLIDVVD